MAAVTDNLAISFFGVAIQANGFFAIGSVVVLAVMLIVARGLKWL